MLVVHVYISIYIFICIYIYKFMEKGFFLVPQKSYQKCYGLLLGKRY